jgi:hypothetical protein
MRLTAFLLCFVLPATSPASPPESGVNQGAFAGVNQGVFAGVNQGAFAGVNRGVFWTVAGIQAGGYSAALIALNYAWYKDYPRSALHFHDDLGDWLQMDKMGHITTTYHLSRLGAEAYRLSGLNRQRAAWLGSASALGFMTAIEVLDGFSEQWGFSVSDQAANVLGLALFMGQEHLWQEQRIGLKFSFSQTELAEYRPDLLGSSLVENIIKDYNGMVFWASLNPGTLLPQWDKLPAWLNLAAGYGAYGMLGGSANPDYHAGMELPHFERHRRWFLSPDIDFSRIPTNSTLLKVFFHAINFLKLPAPAIEYNSQQGWQFHLLYF